MIKMMMAKMMTMIMLMLIIMMIWTFLEGPPMFSGALSYSMVQDDHVPFYNLGLRQILHMIATPFPSVWHTLADDATALHYPTIKQLGRALRVTVFSYLNGTPG